MSCKALVTKASIIIDLSILESCLATSCCAMRFAASLHMTVQAWRIAQQEQAEESLRDLRETLMRKFSTSDACPPGPAELEGTKIAFRLPNAEIIHHTFTAGSTATVRHFTS